MKITLQNNIDIHYLTIFTTNSGELFILFSTFFSLCSDYVFEIFSKEQDTYPTTAWVADGFVLFLRFCVH